MKSFHKNPEFISQEMIKERFTSHRGLYEKKKEQNSKAAIKNGLDKEPPFLEFDIVFRKGHFWTAHPPQKSLAKLTEILELFKNKQTFPKIDLKLNSKQDYHHVLDELVKLINKKEFLRFTLLNIGGKVPIEHINNGREYFVDKIKTKGHIKLNVDPGKMGLFSYGLIKPIKKHMKKINKAVYSISPEIIYCKERKLIPKICKKYNIKHVMFWLRDWPDVKNPKIKEQEILEALELEKYGLKVLFDVNPSCIVLD